MLDPDHDQKQVKHQQEINSMARQDKVSNIGSEKSLKKPRLKISKVYHRGKIDKDGTNSWAFNIKVGNEAPIGLSFASRAGAVKGRILYLNKAKAEGFKVLCQS